MQASNLPTKISVPFANSGAKQSIPIPSQIGIADGRASYTDGFPPLTRTPIVAGGVPPFGTDMNGVLYAITAVQQWQSAGGIFSFDSDFADSIGGYPAGAILLSSDGATQWLNLSDNNSTDPDSTSAANWVPLSSYGIGAVTGLSNANMTLTPAQYGKPILTLAGALTGNVQIIFPNLKERWLVQNNTTGNFTITCKTAAGSGGVVVQGGMQEFFGDGTNLVALPYPTQASIQQATAIVSAAGGTADALTGSFTPAITNLANGLTLYVRASQANTTSTPTFKADATAAKVIVKGANSALISGDIAGAGHWLVLRYDAVLDKWVLENPTGSIGATAPQFDNSSLLATTAFVQRALGSYAGFAVYSSDATLTASQVGYYLLGTTNGMTLTLPNPASLPSGSRFSIQAASIANISVTNPAGNFSGTNGGSASGKSTILLPSGTMSDFLTDGTNWWAVGGSGGSNNVANGFLKLSNSTIIQWGTVSVAGNTTTAFSFPIAFPTAALAIIGSRRIGSAAVYNFGITSATQFQAQNTAASTESGSWIAIGY